VLPGIHNYLAAVGLPAMDLRALVERTSELVNEGERVERKDGTSVTTWRDTSGAALAIYVDADQSILGVLPYHTSARRNRVVPRDVEKDADFDFYDRVVASVVNRRNEGKFELTLYVQDLWAARARLQIGIPGNMAITALGDAWMCVSPETPTRYENIQGQTGIVPVFVDGTPLPSRVLMRGHVLRVDEPLNRHSRVAFQHAKLKVSGIEIDALVPEADQEGSPQQVVAGQMLEGSFLLVGTLDSARHDATMAGVRR
jgi:hypothetical protein